MESTRVLRHALAALALLAVLAPAAAATADGAYYYLDPNRLDLAVLLPPPPNVNSADERSDEEQVAAAVAARSPAQLYDAEEASKRNVFFFAASVGPNFTAQRLPATARFFRRVSSDVERLVHQAKSIWDRPRPNGVASRRGSYPSGHAAFAASSAIILGALLPAKRDAIFEQARGFAENRILLGLHYPSDVATGWTTGTLAAYVMMQNRAFQRDFAECQAELRRANL
jgi:acid phosphatase (class A)